VRASQYHLLLSQSVRAHPAILYPLALAQPIPSPPSGTGLVSEVDTANVDRPLALAQSVWAHRCGEPGLTENGQAEEAEEEEDDDVRERERERERQQVTNPWCVSSNILVFYFFFVIALTSC